MARELRVNTLKDASGNNSVGMSYVFNTNKAWCRFNGTGTPAYHDSFNLGSITDNGTGNFNFAITSAMLNDDYAKVDGGGHYDEQSSGDTTSSVQMRTYSSSVALADYDNVTFVVVGDLA